MNGPHYQTVSAIVCAFLMLTGAVVPFVGPSAAQTEPPDPSIDAVDIPDQITLGESFEVEIQGSNDGSRGGHYSTISVSSPNLDDGGDESQLRVTDDYDHAYSTVIDSGENVFEKSGDQTTADYALAEAGTTGETYWDAGESRDFAAEFTPEEAGTFVVYVRVTHPDDDSDDIFNAPGYGTEDQQGYAVERYEVDVKEESEISAEIDDVDPESGSYTEGEDAYTETTIENTGNRDRDFYVGYSVRGPDGEWRDNDGSTHESVWVEAGDTETVTVDWEVEDGAPSGEYDIWTTVYQDEQGGDLEGQLDEERRSDVFSVTTESHAPSIQAAEPSSQTTISPGAALDFEADVEDPDGDLRGVDWHVDGEYMEHSGVYGSSDTARWDTVFDSTGTYQVEAEAHDEQGKYSDPVSWTISVESSNSPPEIESTSPRSSTSVSSGSEVDFEIDTEDADGNLEGVEWYVDNDLKDETFGIDSYADTAVWDRSFDEPGTYEVEAVVFDDNRAYSETVSWTVGVEADNSPPEIDRTSPEDSTTVTTGSEVDFEVDAEDPDGNLAGIEWYVDSDLEAETSSIDSFNDAGAWEHTFSEPGVYTVEAVGYDENRAYSDPVSWTVTVEYDDPAVSLSKAEPESPTTAKINEDVEFEAVVTESADAIDDVAWYVDDEQRETIAGASETVSWQTFFDSAGEHTVTARVSTEAENDVASVSWTVEVSEPDVESTVEWDNEIPETVADDEQLTLTAAGTTATDGELCLVSGSNEFDADAIACRDIDTGEFEESFMVRSGTDFAVEDSEQTTLSFRLQEERGDDTWSADRTIRTESTQGLTVTAEDKDGDPLSNAEVDVDGLGVETTNEEGKATFENIPDSESEVTVTDASGHVVETESVSPETVSVVVEFPQLEPVSGVIRDDNGDPLPEGTEVEIRGTSFVDRVDRSGEFALPYQLPEGDYTLHIEEYEPIELDVDGTPTTHEFQTIKTSKTKLATAREKAFTKGVVCGDPCWSARNYNEEHSLAYLSGWIITGVTPGIGALSDGRDFGSSLARGDAIDAGLSGLAIASGPAAAPKSAKTIRKFIGRYPSKSDEVAKLVLKSDKIPTSVLYKSVYRNAPESVKAADDAVVLRLVDEGADLNTVRLGEDITTADVDTVARNVDEMDEVRMITKDGTDSVRWLDEGTQDVGWEHIKVRHIEGTYEVDKKWTTFWPTGETIKGRTLQQAMEPDDVKSVIQRAVKESENVESARAGRVDYVYSPNDYGISEVTVRVDPSTGQIESAWPSAGDNVVGWSPDAQRFIENPGS